MGGHGAACLKLSPCSTPFLSRMAGQKARLHLLSCPALHPRSHHHSPEGWQVPRAQTESLQHALTPSPMNGMLRGTGNHGAGSCCAGRGSTAACAAAHAPKLNGIIHLFWLQKGVCWKSCEACLGPAAMLFPGMAGMDRRAVTRRWSLGLRTLRDCPHKSSGA